jgi:phenylalanine-4-hydroxylase
MASSYRVFEYSTGLQVRAGQLDLVKDATSSAMYLSAIGPTELYYANQLLTGHDKNYHPEGFGSPVGRLKGLASCLSTLPETELAALNIRIGESCRLLFESGICVVGCLEKIVRKNSLNLIFTLSECSVTNESGELLFKPDWGLYDMAIGDISE